MPVIMEWLQQLFLDFRTPASSLSPSRFRLKNFVGPPDHENNIMRKIMHQKIDIRYIQFQVCCAFVIVLSLILLCLYRYTSWWWYFLVQAMKSKVSRMTLS